MTMDNPVSIIVDTVPIRCHTDKKSNGVFCAKQVEASMYTAIQALGFEYARYTCWVQDIAQTGFDQHSFGINFSNFPPEWERAYESKQYYRIDPVLQALYGPKDIKLVYGTWDDAWQAAENTPLDSNSKEQKKYISAITQLRKHAAEFGIRSGIYMMVHSDIRKLVISLASSRSPAELAASVNEALYQEIFSLVSLCYSSLQLTNNCNECSKSLRIGGGPSIKLTKMQVKILQSFSLYPSATTADISKIYSVGIDTINFHLKTIRAKLNKPNASGHSLSSIAKEHGLI